MLNFFLNKQSYIKNIIPFLNNIYKHSKYNFNENNKTFNKLMGITLEDQKLKKENYKKNINQEYRKINYEQENQNNYNFNKKDNNLEKDNTNYQTNNYNKYNNQFKNKSYENNRDYYNNNQNNKFIGGSHNKYQDFINEETVDSDFDRGKYLFFFINKLSSNIYRIY